MSIVTSKVWTEYVSALEAGSGTSRGIKAAGIQKRLLAGLRPADVAALVDLYARTKSQLRSMASLRVLSILLRNNDKRLTVPQRERLERSLSRKVRSGYPAVAGLYQWAALEPEAAREFILVFDPEGLRAKEAQRYAEDLANFRLSAPASLDRLKAIASSKGVGAAAAAAQAVLKRISPPSRAVVAAKGRAWRLDRRASELGWLYYNHVSQLPQGAPIRPLLFLLGKSDHVESMSLVSGGVGCEYLWKPADTPDSGWLRVFADGKGTLRERGFK